MPPLTRPIIVVFDVEGTLVDCVPLILESWRETLQQAGHSFTHLDLQPFSGMDGAWMLEQLLPKESRDSRQRLLRAQGEIYKRDFMGRAQPFPGVRKLFEALKQDGTLIGLATTCQKDQLAVYDQRMDILSLTDVVACGDSVKHGKPDTSLFRHCLEATKTDPPDAIAVGDTPYDAIAARQLEMRALGVLTGGFQERVLRESGCELVFDQVQHMFITRRDASATSHASGLLTL
jgi:HAD superfamily hydrolase (TIGR01509 family)